MGIAVATITCAGETLAPGVDVLSLEIRKEVDRIPEARLVLRDGSVARREFVVSNAASFALGTKVQIELRYEGEVDEQVFEGLVVRHAVEARLEGSELRVELKDVAFKLTRQRRSAVHRGQKDEEVFRKLAGDAGLRVGKLDKTAVEHRELVQHHASDWDFLVARADVNGQVVIVDDGELSVRAMTAEAPVKARFEYGLDVIHEFELELDGGSQWAKIAGQAWDLAQQAVTEPIEAAQVKIAAGNLDVPSVAETLGGERCTLLLPSPLTDAELGPWADARLARSRLAQLRGRLVVGGRADIKPFDRVELGGVGERFDGALVVAGVMQRFDHDGWRTELLLGLSPEWFARTPDIEDVAAGGLLPPITVLQIGVVDAFEADPQDEQRIKVRLPAFDAEQGAVWARMARPDAGKDRGMVFWPEPKDEVVVGFLGGDPRQAVVLGALHGSVNLPPAAAGSPSEANGKRAIVSKAGTIIGFDDDKASLTIETPKKNTIVVDDDAETIKIADQHGNTITMDAKGITLTSAGDFKIDASGKVAIKGSAVDIQ